MPRPTIAIIGAGFSGTSLSLWLQASAPMGSRICLVGDTDRFAVGRAFATPNPNHLLNVPAGRMSAFPDLPDDFVHWLQKQPKCLLGDTVPIEAAFVPRVLYGVYLQHLLKRGLCDARCSKLELVHDEVIRLEEHADGVTLYLGSGAMLEADIAILATGNAPPLPMHPDVIALDAAGLWRGDPWTPNAFAALDRDAPVLLVGTGLTMVDAAISLLDVGHTGPIHALSRHGLLPRRHAEAPVQPIALPTPFPSELSHIVRTVRQEIARVLEAGQDWRPVIDALRPTTQRLWQHLTDVERSRFLRHLRAWWDVHRHRMPPQAADRIEAAQAANRLRVYAGRIIALAVANGLAKVSFRERANLALRSLTVQRVIDCSGPGCDATRSTDPLVQALLRTGMARPDPLRLGLDVSEGGALLTRSGVPSRRLFAVGPLTKGALWEITSVPDIRVQCRDLGKRLAEIAKGNGGERHRTRGLTGVIRSKEESGSAGSAPMGVN